MTVVLGTYNGENLSPPQPGWTTFVQDGGGTKYYVSSSDAGASDSNNGTAPVFVSGSNGPWKTAAGAFNNLNALKSGMQSGVFATCTTSGNVLTMGSVTSGNLLPGDAVQGTDGTSFLPNVRIVSQLTGTPGGSAGATFQMSRSAVLNSSSNTAGNLTSCTVTGYRFLDHWLLFRKGDTWTDAPGSLTIGGASANNPLVVGCYDPNNPGVVDPTTGGANPIFKIPYSTSGATAISINLGGGGQVGGNYVAFVGLAPYNYTNDPDNAGFQVGNAQGTGFNFQSPLDWNLIEDCQPTFFQENFFLTAAGNAALSGTIIIRRCVSTDAQCLSEPGDLNSAAQGIFILGWTNPIINEGFLDHNGWTESPNVGGTATASISHASPCAVTITGFTGVSPLSIENQIHFSSGGNGISANTEYYIASDPSGGSFTITDAGGNPVNTTGTLSTTMTWDTPGLGERQRSHNMYCTGTPADPRGQQPPVTFWGNVSSRDASGMQMRFGAYLKDTVFVQDPIPTSFRPAAGGYALYIQNCVVVEPVPSILYLVDQYGNGFELDCVESAGGIEYSGTTTGVASGNIFANGVNGQGVGFGFVLEPGINGWTVDKNYLFSFDTSGGSFNQTAGAIYGFGSVAGSSFTPGTYTGVALSGGSGTGAQADITVSGGGSVTSITPSYTVDNPNEGVNPFGQNYKVGDTLTGTINGAGFSVNVASLCQNPISINVTDAAGTNAQGPPEPFPHPTLTLGNYMQQLGLGSTTLDFIRACRQQTKANWNPAITGPAATAWFQRNYGVGLGNSGIVGFASSEW